jgi:N-acetylglutamate synthase-like GNAT family acetyltransferase
MGGEMTTRILPRSEYDRLAGTELEAVYPYLPDGANVVVIEDRCGAIVGCWALFQLVHVEGVWIAPEHRGRGRVALKLLQGMKQVAQAMGAQAVSTASVSEDVSTMLHKLGAVKLEGSHFSLKVGS